EFLVSHTERTHEEQPQLVAAARERNVVAEFAGPPAGEQEWPAGAAHKATVPGPWAAADEIPVRRPSHSGAVDDFAAVVAGHHVQLRDLIARSFRRSDDRRRSGGGGRAPVVRRS